MRLQTTDGKGKKIVTTQKKTKLETVTVATMDSERFSFVSVGRDEAEARRGMAAAFDQHLDRYGDASRERFLFSLGYWGDDDAEDVLVIEDADLPPRCTMRFGVDLDAFAAVLHGWYGIRPTQLEMGKGEES